MHGKIGRDLLRSLAKTPPPRQVDIVDTDLRGFVLRWRPSGRHSYLVRTPRGWLVLGRVDELKPEKARALAEAKRGELAAGRDLLADKAAEKARQRAQWAEAKARHAQKAQTLASYLEETYTPWCEAHLKTGAETPKRLTATFPTLLDVPLAELTPWHLESWKTSRRRAKRTAKTINRDLSDLKAMLARAVLWGHLPAHPLAEVKPEKVDRRAGIVVRYLTAEEEARLRTALEDRDDTRRKERDQANAWRRDRGYPVLPSLPATYTDHLTPLVLLALNTGLRRGELLGLQWGAVNWAHQLLTVRGTTSKTGDTRHVDLNTEAIAVLKTWRDVVHGARTPLADALVFPGPSAEVMGDVKASWTTVREAAGLSDFRFHDLRHTFASKLVQRGVPLQVVAHLLGHATIQMTLRYAHLAPNQTRDAVAKLVEASR